MKAIDISKYEEVERKANYYEEQYNKLEQENKQLKEQLAIREKALELACEKAVLYADSEQALDSMEYKHEVEYLKYYCITEAKESLKCQQTTK